MNATVIPIRAEGASRERKRQAPKGRQVDPAARDEVRALLGEGPYRRDLLIEYLHRVNDRFGNLGAGHLAALAQLMKLAQTEVYEVASFYHHFDIVKEGEAAPAELTVRVCDGLSCEMAGAASLLQRLPSILGREVRVIAAPCVGRCEQAPVAVVHHKPVPKATPQAVQAAVAAGEKEDRVEGFTGYDAYVAQGGYTLLRECLEGRRSVEGVIQALDDAGLRGLGGAGFPAGRKWRIVRNEPAPRLMAVNIDEGEPGTFKDRWLLERDPHRFLEGLGIAAWAVGIAAVYVYLRDEYHGCRALLEAELARLRREFPALPPIELRRGAGAYICGEESAMIESIEGKRGMPRLRPPYVAQVGLFGRPTLEHNFETLYWVRELLEKGGAWFASHGRHGRKGLRRYSVSGRVRDPGVKLAPAGITLRELVDEFCGGMAEGHQLYAYLPGGASGGILPASMADIPLDFDTLQPHGCFIGSAAVMVLSQQDRAVDAARNLMRFFEHESCGQCTPCRNGTAKARALIEQDRWDTALLAELSQVMRDASICGLGQAAPNPVDCVVKYFPQELEAPMLAPDIKLKLDGREVSARPGETLIELADRLGVEIPRLCYKPGLEPAGNCRACVVEVKGERTLAASCCRAVAPNMEVQTASERARKSQKLVLELLQADLPAAPLKRDDEVEQWSERLGVGKPRFAARAVVPVDHSHAAMTVTLDACIQCTRCLRACRDVQGNDVIGLAQRGAHAKIVFDMDDPMGASSCVACGECVQACPTGALAPAQGAATVVPDRSVDSLCPYCGVGCQVTYHVKDDQVVHVEGRDGPANHGRLCVKGRYGFDYVRHPHRLTVPLIRRPGVPKDTPVDPANPFTVFREASWDEALDLAGGTLKALRDRHGPQALAGFGSAKGSNEEAYLFQKLVRLGFGSNNVDHCTRLCHASSVAALLEGIGSGAVSNPVMDVLQAEVIVVIGANPSVNHPVAASWIKNAVHAGAKLVMMDPRRGDLSRLAWRHVRFKPDTDVALLNAMMNVIVTEGLVDRKFIAERTENYEALAANVKGYDPERMAPICGVPAETIREVARAYATSKGSMILWGMGVSQHVHGTDNARCLIALALMTGQIGRPGTGLHPLRGQNNVQGASDAGLIPMMYPDYQRVDNPEARARMAAAWGVPESTLDTRPGLTVVEVMRAIDAGTVKGMYIQGENPAMSDPDANHARHAMASLEMLVVQDLFVTETAALADVVLPASAFAEKLGTFTNTDRIVQLARPVLPLPGQARQDLELIVEMARRLGLEWSHYGQGEAAVGAVFEEMRHTMPSIAGISWRRMLKDGAVTYPCEHEEDPGEVVVFTDHFPRPGGKARFVPADIIPAAERPDDDYPLVLITGRQLEHWHTGSMTRRSQVLDAIEPEPVAMFHPQDLARLGLAPGERVTLESRRGRVSLFARADEGSPQGSVFVAFCWYEAAINKLTNPALDPVAKIPEFKYCAVRVLREEAVPA